MSLSDRMLRLMFKTVYSSVDAMCSDVGFRRWWVVLLFFSLLSVIDIPGAVIFTEPYAVQWFAAVCVAAMKATVIDIVLWWICRRTRLLRVPGIILVIFYMLAAVANALAFVLYGFGISAKMCLIVAQTNLRETMEFLPGFVSNILAFDFMWRMAAVLLIVIAASIGVRFVGSRAFGIIAGTLSVVGLAYFAYVGLTMREGRNTMLLSLRLPKTVWQTYTQTRILARLSASLPDFPDADKVRADGRAATVVMVIGESASRAGHAVYGYPLADTPRVSAMADSLAVFTDVIGSSQATAFNMSRILSFQSDYAPDDDWYKYPLLFDLFNAAGYRTWWLSNQEQIGVWSNASGAMATHADVREYLSASGEDGLLRSYDEALLPLFETAMTDSAARRFIGLHLMGSHVDYCKRFPPDRKHFTSENVMKSIPRPWLTAKKAQTVADYANSIMYTDSLLGRIMDILACNPKPAVMIYFSDHGENVYSDRDFCGRDRRHVEVPFYIYANRAYREANAEMMARVNAARQTPFSTANVIYPLMTLAGISCPLSDATRDFLSDSYVPRRRYVDERVWEYDK